MLTQIFNLTVRGRGDLNSTTENLSKLTLRRDSVHDETQAYSTICEASELCSERGTDYDLNESALLESFSPKIAKQQAKHGNHHNSELQSVPFKEKNTWVTFSGTLTTTVPDQVYSFPSKSVFQAVKFALEQMKAPNCPTPENFRLAKSEEIQTLMERFKTRFQGSSHSRGCKSKDLLNMLVSFAEAGMVHKVFSRLSVNSTPKDTALDFFILTWLSSAVNFLTERQCLEHEHRQNGIHVHADGWVYSPKVWLKGAGNGV